MNQILWVFKEVLGRILASTGLIGALFISPIFAFASTELPLACGGYESQSSRFSDISTIPLPVALHYRQTHLQSLDPKGDVALIRYALAAPWGLFWKLSQQPQKLDHFEEIVMAAKPCGLEFFGVPDRAAPTVDTQYQRTPTYDEVTTIERLPTSWQKRAELLERLKRGQIYLGGRRASIRVDGFVKMIGKVIQEEWFETKLLPRLGDVHHWAPQTKTSLRPDYQAVIRFPKLLTALTIGESSRYMAAPADEALRLWILSQPKRSIEPADLFRVSYRLSRGDVYLSLLSIENVLSRHWRHKNRERLEQTLKLTPIVNQFGGDGSVFGTWYHFWGLVLLGYSEGELVSRFVGEVESLGSQILNWFSPEFGETEINRRAGQVGALVRQMLANQSWKSLPLSLSYTRLQDYLDLNENFQSRLLEL